MGSPKERVSIAMKWDITPKICHKPKSGNWAFKVIALIANLAQSERNYFIFFKEKISK
jgi:hypothetical protein